MMLGNHTLGTAYMGAVSANNSTGILATVYLNAVRFISYITTKKTFAWRATK